MEAQAQGRVGQSGTSFIIDKACVHGRLLDSVVTRGGKKTGRVRCLECGAIVEDPAQCKK